MQIRRKGVQERPLVDFYHRMMRLSWGYFFFYIFVIFFVFNVFFAVIFQNFAPLGIANIPAQTFWNYFFFSVQTSASIGYGYYYPNTQAANLIVSIEAFGGLLMNALITGLVFARFSRPSARIVFSQKLIWVNYYGKSALMLRLGNARTNRIFSGRAKWTYLKDEVTPEGDSFRRLFDLKLQRDETSVFALSWTLIHVIDEQSPLFGVKFSELQQSPHEFMVTFSGLDEETSQTLSTHAMYWARDVVQAKKYADMIKLNTEGVREIDFSKITDIVN